MKLRRYRTDDNDAVRRLHYTGLDQVGANLGPGPWDADLAAIEDVYLREGEFLVAEVDGEIVAMGALRPAGNGISELKRLRVDARLQRRGLGERIVRALLLRAEELGFGCVVLDTTTKQEPARRLFEKLGFHETGRRFVRGVEVVLYSKDLP